MSPPLELLLTFLKKYFFILKAASDGWRITYIGGNEFKFYGNINKCMLQNTYTTSDFISRYI